MRHRKMSHTALILLSGSLLLGVTGCRHEPAEKAAPAAQAPGPSPTTSAPAAASTASTTATPPRQGTGSTPTQERPVPVQASSTPPIQVIPRTLDWGIVAPRASVSGSVRLENTSDKPLKIISIQPSCKCTTTDDLNGQTIPPRGSVELEAVLDAQPNPGPRTTQIRVLIEGYGNVLTIQAKAEIARPIRTRPPYINAVEGKNPIGSYMVSSLDRSPFKILSVQGREPSFLQPGDANQLKNSYVLTYDIEEYLQPDGRYPRFIVVETDRADSPLVEIMLRHELSTPKLSRDFKINDYKVNLGRVAPGGSVDHEIGIQESTTTGPLVAVLGDESIVRAEIVDQTVNEETDALLARVQFTVPEGTPEGFYYFPLQLYASNQADLEIPAFISVRTDPGRQPGAEPVSPDNQPIPLPGASPSSADGSN